MRELELKFSAYVKAIVQEMGSTARSDDERDKAKEAKKAAKGKGSGSSVNPDAFVFFEDVTERVKLGDGVDAKWDWVLRAGH